jgi:hypothetical protein
MLLAGVRFLFCSATAGAILFSTGCLWKQKREGKQLPASSPQFVGIVTLVNEEGRFVLIDAGFGRPPTAGVALKTFTGEAESGLVTVGAVRRPPFVIGDIVKGEPRKGDHVFQ